MPLYKKKYAPKSKLVRRKRLARRPMLRRPVVQGRFKISRKTALIQAYSHASIAGVMQLNDPSGTCVSLGTPVLVTGTTNVYDVPFSMKFRLDQLMNSTDLTNIADQYKINSVKVRIHCNNINESYAGSAGGGQPWLEYIQDHDDAAVPTLAQMREKMGVRTKFFSATRPFILVGVRPRVADAIFNNGVTTAYAVNKRSQYINMAYPSAEHYAIKGVLHNVQLIGASASPQLFDFDVTQYLTVAGIQ